MKAYFILLTVFFVLSGSAFGGTLHLTLARNAALTLHLRRRDFEFKNAKQCVPSVVKASKCNEAGDEKLPQIRLTNVFCPVRIANDFAIDTFTDFSRSVTMIQDRLLSPPPTPPPIA